MKTLLRVLAVAMAALFTVDAASAATATNAAAIKVTIGRRSERVAIEAERMTRYMTMAFDLTARQESKLYYLNLEWADRCDRYTNRVDLDIIVNRWYYEYTRDLDEILNNRQMRKWRNAYGVRVGDYNRPRASISINIGAGPHVHIGTGHNHSHSAPHTNPHVAPHKDPHTKPHVAPHKDPHTKPHVAPHKDPHTKPHTAPHNGNVGNGNNRPSNNKGNVGNGNNRPSNNKGNVGNGNNRPSNNKGSYRSSGSSNRGNANRNGGSTRSSNSSGKSDDKGGKSNGSRGR